MQLFLYVKGILSLDLGFSFRQQMPVATLILQRLPATLLLTGTAFAKPPKRSFLGLRRRLAS